MDYTANKGLEWVILTNGVEWKVFKLLFTKPIQNILVADINFLNLKFKSNDDLELLYTLTKEAVIKKSLEEFYTQKQATNKFMIGNLLACDGVVASIKKELKGIYPEIKVTNEEIHNVLFKEVIKREITEGDEADEAKKKINKALKKKEKDKEKASSKPNGLTPVNESETPKAEETLN